ncbi:MAG: MBL fold metallo-hydrolase, partial [Actinobacteria bacterium]|nr:MBL fold metallo-hydrolase [Actinomycetota bacterium]NIU18007.1 MBL fold metallo-hydrolase [Actinomycetota bacterium]NIV54497.1 MBL fold metallo-hydrolase [Actinomycetota bacterium]NIW26396.1 MBL fold metallo-hydrolase [Actinomycetota bacterium]NIX18964.1 MBL fold metallo-hydrolase [Actinomycetota bacterium]
TRLWIDPFLSDNPLADLGPDEIDRADYILITHGHGDHTGDGFDIAKRTGATLISSFELISFAAEVLGLEDGHPLSIGGGYDFPFG